MESTFISSPKISLITSFDNLFGVTLTLWLWRVVDEQEEQKKLDDWNDLPPHLLHSMFLIWTKMSAVPEDGVTLAHLSSSSPSKTLPQLSQLWLPLKRLAEESQYPHLIESFLKKSVFESLELDSIDP
jgi:hypothetical protein